MMTVLALSSRGPARSLGESCTLPRRFAVGLRAASAQVNPRLPPQPPPRKPPVKPSPSAIWARTHWEPLPTLSEPPASRTLTGHKPSETRSAGSSTACRPTSAPRWQPSPLSVKTRRDLWGPGSLPQANSAPSSVICKPISCRANRTPMRASRRATVTSLPLRDLRRSDTGGRSTLSAISVVGLVGRPRCLPRDPRRAHARWVAPPLLPRAPLSES
jgi:hypothetical protein